MDHHIKCLVALICLNINIFKAQESRNEHYITNQEPLVNQPFTPLPLGSIQADGWLLEMLERQRNGLTGDMDEIYPLVMGRNNGWLGGNGDRWERGPYWLDGLTPLAFQLNDSILIQKVKKWVDWSIENQREDGYFGPFPSKKGEEVIPGTQQKNSRDWWPKMVMLKVFQQYYQATKDERILKLLDKYFQFQLKNLPHKPLGKWTFWAERRGADNLQIIYWYYNITKKTYLLKLAEIVHSQTHNWKSVHISDAFLNQNPTSSIHCVNIAQGIKAPLIYYQQSHDTTDLYSPKVGLNNLRKGHGWANGMYGADEALHGNDPTQGSELCSAVELMYSLESMLPISGDLYYADYLEKIAFNVLPTQITDDFSAKQYFQQANQIMITNEKRNFDNGYGGTSTLFGILTGYPCCVSNMHQGWPKFTQSLYHATSDNGIAALVYAPSKAEIIVASGTKVKIKESTRYPFSDEINFELIPQTEVSFSFYFRIPEWADTAEAWVNGKKIKIESSSKLQKITRKWSKGDIIRLKFPMQIRTSKWYEHSVAIEHGPLLYGLKIGEKWKKVNNPDFNHPYYEVYPTTSWNYGIPLKVLDDNDFEIKRSNRIDSYPWNLKNAPVQIFTKGKRIPYWKAYNGNTGKLPLSTDTKPFERLDTPEEIIELVPYGCTTLRISQFPVVELYYRKLKSKE